MAWISAVSTGASSLSRKAGVFCIKQIHIKCLWILGNYPGVEGGWGSRNLINYSFEFFHDTGGNWTSWMRSWNTQNVTKVSEENQRFPSQEEASFLQLQQSCDHQRPAVRDTVLTATEARRRHCNTQSHLLVLLRCSGDFVRSLLLCFAWKTLQAVSDKYLGKQDS